MEHNTAVLTNVPPEPINVWVFLVEIWNSKYFESYLKRTTPVMHKNIAYLVAEAWSRRDQNIVRTAL